MSSSRQHCGHSDMMDSDMTADAPTPLVGIGLWCAPSVSGVAWRSEQQNTHPRRVYGGPTLNLNPKP